MYFYTKYLTKSYDSLRQGSQTQSDSRAAWDSKKGLVDCIWKSEKKLPSNFQLKTKKSWKNRQIVFELKKKNCRIFRFLRAALDPCLRPLR